MNLQDLRVIITGAAGGAGITIAQRFHAAGARVHVADIDAAAITGLQKGLQGLSASQCDCGDAGAVARLFTEAGDRLGGLDVLINNVGIAGMGGAYRPIENALARQRTGGPGYGFSTGLDELGFGAAPAPRLVTE